MKFRRKVYGHERNLGVSPVWQRRHVYAGNPTEATEKVDMGIKVVARQKGGQVNENGFKHTGS